MLNLRANDLHTLVKACSIVQQDEGTRCAPFLTCYAAEVWVLHPGVYWIRHYTTTELATFPDSSPLSTGKHADTKNTKNTPITENII